MATEVVMPQMGESVAEGTITRWMAQVGERVERDQPLFEISTDKVDAEIPSPGDGVLLEIRYPEGTTVPVDEVVALIGEAGEQATAPTAPVVAVEPVAEAVVADPMIGQPVVVQPVAVEPMAVAPVATQGTAPSAPESAREVERVRTHSSPVVRKMAEQHGLDISAIPGTGIHGRVTKADVERYIAKSGEAAVVLPTPSPAEVSGVSAAADQIIQPVAPAPLPSSAPVPDPVAPTSPAPTQATPTPAVPTTTQPAPAQAAQVVVSPAPAAQSVVEQAPAKVGLPAKRAVPPPTTRSSGDFYVAPYGPNDNVEIEPMSRIRQITAAHMSYSKSTAAHVTTLFHVDMSRVARIRKQAKEKFEAAQDTKLSYMPFIFRAIANALKSHRKLNASIDGTNIVFKRDINLGMAVALDWGLIVPVIKNADQLSLLGLAKQANDLAAQARSKKLSPDDIQGGTFTVTNPGVYGSLFGTPIINQPQVAILGLGAIEKRPVVVTDSEGNDTIAIKTMCYMAITYDHRLVDGADADHFMNDIRHTLANESWNELDPYL